jgi:hypothetical protein
VGLLMLPFLLMILAQFPGTSGPMGPKLFGAMLFILVNLTPFLLAAYFAQKASGTSNRKYQIP